jgi:hypothetical protein
LKNFDLDVYFTKVVGVQEEKDYYNNLLLIAIFSGAIAVSMLLRGIGFQRLILTKGKSWHFKILEVI